MFRLKHIPFFLFVFFLFTPAAFSYQQIKFTREIAKPAQPKGKRLLKAPKAIALSGKLIYIADSGAHRVVGAPLLLYIRLVHYQ